MHEFVLRRASGALASTSNHGHAAPLHSSRLPIMLRRQQWAGSRVPDARCRVAQASQPAVANSQAGTPAPVQPHFLGAQPMNISLQTGSEHVPASLDTSNQHAQPADGAAAAASRESSAAGTPSSNGLDMLPKTTPVSTSKSEVTGPLHRQPRHVPQAQPVAGLMWKPTGAATRRNMLTLQLSRSNSARELQQLLSEHYSDFNFIHTAACLTRLARLAQQHRISPREARLLYTSVPRLMGLVKAQAGDFDGRGLLAVSHALARLEMYDRDAVTALVAAAEPLLGSMRPEFLSGMLWAFSSMSHQPPVRWMEALVASACAHIDTYAPRDVATLLWSLANLNYKLAPTRLETVLAAVTGQLQCYDGRALCNVLHGLAVTGAAPGEAWLAAVQAHMATLDARSMTPQSMTQALWSFARLLPQAGAMTDPALATLALRHMAAGVSKQAPSQVIARELSSRNRRSAGPSHVLCYEGIDTATGLYAMAKLGIGLPPRMVPAVLSHTRNLLHSLDPNHQANIIWALARMASADSSGTVPSPGLRIPPNWLSTFFMSTGRRMAELRPADLAQMGWALALLGVLPPAEWVSAFEGRVLLAARLFAPREVANVMWALSRMGAPLPSELLSEFFDATDRRLSSFSGPELGAMVTSLARSGVVPNKEWLSEFLKATFHKMQANSLGPQALANIVWGLAELRVHPPPAWLVAYAAATRSALPSMSAIDLGQVVAGLTTLASASSSAADPAVSSAGGSGSGSSSSTSYPSLGLPKVDDLVADALAALAAGEARESAYSRLQVRRLMALRSDDHKSQQGEVRRDGKRRKHPEHDVSANDGGDDGQTAVLTEVRAALAAGTLEEQHAGGQTPTHGDGPDAAATKPRKRVVGKLRSKVSAYQRQNPKLQPPPSTTPSQLGVGNVTLDILNAAGPATLTTGALGDAQGTKTANNS